MGALCTFNAVIRLRNESRRGLALASVAGALALAGLIGLVWFEWFAPGPSTAWVRTSLALAATAGVGVALALLVVEQRRLIELDRRAGAQASARERAWVQLLDLLPLPVAVCDATPAGAMANQALTELVGIQRGAGLPAALDWQQLIVESDRSAWAEAVQQVQATGREHSLQLSIRIEGAPREMLVQLAAVSGELFDAPGARLLVMLRGADDAGAHRVQQQLRELLRLAESEKWLFGQAVHDELGQRLSGIAYFAKALERKLQADGRTEAEDAAWLTNLANESMSVARGLARGLVPVGSDDAGALAASLTELCQNTSKMFGAQCTLEADPLFDAGGAAEASHLYHVVQELMTNGIKHGQARNVAVRLELLEQGRRLTVQDDGTGFDAQASATRRGMGLSGVRSRVAHLGGSFTMGATQAGGVIATIELPLRASPSSDMPDGENAQP